MFAASGSGSERVLYSFAQDNDGANPQGGVVNDRGTLYGTTYFGGSGFDGIVYGVNAAGQETIVHDFGSSGDGQNPQGDPILYNALFGTTQNGGANNAGTVYELIP